MSHSLRGGDSDALHLVVDATGLKIFGQGEWAAWKHGARRAGPGWRKLHVGVDADGFTADGAYDGRPVYEAVLWAGPAPKIVISPMRTAAVAGSSEPMLAQRDAAIELIRQAGRRRWKKTAGYHQQARAENTFSRYKRIIGRRLRAQTTNNQHIKVIIACEMLNQMSSLGLPDSGAVLSI